MSYPRLVKLRQSFVFRTTILSSCLFFGVAVLLVGVSAYWTTRAAESELRQEMLEEVEELRRFYRDDGMEALIVDLFDEDEAIISEADAFFILDEGEWLFLLSDANGIPVGGYPAMMRKRDGWFEFQVGYDDEQVEARLYRKTLADGSVIHIASNRSGLTHDLHESLRLQLTLLVLCIVPLALITAYYLSRGVYGRLEGLSTTLARIGDQSVSGRLPISPKHDEFDRLAQHINAMLDRIESLHKNIETVSVGIAHDLKTPLSRLSNRLHLIRSDKQHPETVEMHLQQAELQLDSLLKTFQGLLRLSEIESGERRQSFSRFDFSEWVGDLIESYEPVFADAGRELEHSIMPDIELLGDRDLIGQMLINLLENSIEHGRQGGKSWVRLQAHKNGVVLQVGDDGPGIQPASRSRVFDRFYREDRSRHSPGNGLGLSLVKSICDLHDAEIVLLDQNSGAVFDIYFTDVSGNRTIGD